MTMPSRCPDLTSAVAKCGRRIVPILFLCFAAAYLDRVNVSFAQLQMQRDLGLSATAYGLGASIFFIGYLIFEVPSNLALERFGARLWIARIMISWGIISGLTMFVQNQTQFYILRFLLGALEAGVVPAGVYYFSKWLPSEQRGRANTIFFGSIAFCGIISSPLSGGIMQYFDDVAGLAGWQWLFMLEAFPSLVLGVVVLAMLDDKIEDARWLTDGEKSALSAAVTDEVRNDATHDFGAALKQPLTWLFAIIYIGLAMGNHGLAFWMPQLVKAAGTQNVAAIGLIVMLPYLIAMVGIVLVARSSDRTGERRWHLAGCFFTGAVGYALCASFGSSTTILVIGLSAAVTGILAAFGLFWIFPARALTGRAAAGGMALINAIGQIGGIIAPYMVGFIKDATGSPANGLYAIAVVCALAATLVTFALPRRLYYRDSGTSMRGAATGAAPLPVGGMEA